MLPVTHRKSPGLELVDGTTGGITQRPLNLSGYFATNIGHLPCSAARNNNFSNTLPISFAASSLLWLVIFALTYSHSSSSTQGWLCDSGIDREKYLQLGHWLISRPHFLCRICSLSQLVYHHTRLRNRCSHRNHAYRSILLQLRRLPIQRDSKNQLA